MDDLLEGALEVIGTFCITSAAVFTGVYIAPKIVDSSKKLLAERKAVKAQEEAAAVQAAKFADYDVLKKELDELKAKKA